MIAALRTEYRKLVTTRMWWVVLVAMAAYMAFLAAIMAFVLARDPGAAAGPFAGAEADPRPLDAEGLAQTVYTLATSLGYVFPVTVGALAMTGEFRHRTITPTLLAEPRRTVVLVAKLVSSTVVGLLYGLVGTAATVAAGALVLHLLGEDPALSEPIVLRSAVLSVLALTVWTVVGVAFGTLLTQQVAVIVVLLAFTQFVEPILRVVMAQLDWAQDAAKYLPGAAGEAITGASFYADSGLGPELLSSGEGLAVLLAYAVVLAGLGRLLTLRSDIT